MLCYACAMRVSADWEYVLNTFAFGYAIGYHFIECEDNNGGPGNMNGNFLG